jgi:hypothetical protein
MLVHKMVVLAAAQTAARPAAQQVQELLVHPDKDTMVDQEEQEDLASKALAAAVAQVQQAQIAVAVVQVLAVLEFKVIYPERQYIMQAAVAVARQIWATPQEH